MGARRRCQAICGAASREFNFVDAASTNWTTLIGDGMLAQLFMLEVPEPTVDPTTEALRQMSSQLPSFSSKRLNRDPKDVAYRHELQTARAMRSGTADYARLVTLLRQAVTSGCFMDTVTEYVVNHQFFILLATCQAWFSVMSPKGSYTRLHRDIYRTNVASPQKPFQIASLPCRLTVSVSEWLFT